MSKPGVATRRLSMWLAVAGVSLITPTLANMAADRFPQLRGLNALVNYNYRRSDR